MNHESGADINLDHDIIKRKPKAYQFIKHKDSFEQLSFSMV
jgi:hypothetical protein